MKKHAFTLVLLAGTTVIYFCNSSKEKAFQTTEGVAVSKLNDAFGNDAHYTDISIGYTKGVGTTISATGIKDPASPKLTRKIHANGDREDMSEVPLEVSGGDKPSDFMFTLAEIDGLKKIPHLVQFATDKVKKRKIWAP